MTLDCTLLLYLKKTINLNLSNLVMQYKHTLHQTFHHKSLYPVVSVMPRSVPYDTLKILNDEEMLFLVD
jgi:hypothetical protein